MINYVKLNDLVFSYDNENNEIRLVGNNKNTIIKYTIGSEGFNPKMYYDLVTVYNTKEKWYRNIPVPIFVEAFIPYCKDELLIQKYKRYKEERETSSYEELTDKEFWNVKIYLRDIPFLCNFLTNLPIYNECRNTEDTNNVDYDGRDNRIFISRSALNDIKMKIREDEEAQKFKCFLPIMKAVGFEFENDTDDNTRLNSYYTHTLERVLKSNVLHKPDNTVKSNYVNLPRKGDEDCDDYYDDDNDIPWGLYGYFSFHATPQEYVERDGTHLEEHLGIEDYLRNLMHELNPENCERDMRDVVRYYDIPETEREYVYVREVINREELAEYNSTDYLPTKYVEMEWNKEMYDKALTLYEKCETDYEKVLDSTLRRGTSHHVSVSQLLASAENHVDLNMYTTNLLLNLNNESINRMIDYVDIFDDIYSQETRNTVKDFLEKLHSKRDNVDLYGLTKMCKIED